MENFARRGIRTTVAVAGLAALGVGLAAPTAFALPSVPDISGVGNTQAVPSPRTPRPPGRAARSPARSSSPRPPPSSTRRPTRRRAARARGRGVDGVGDDRADEAGESTETTQADESEATEADPAESTESTEAAPAATTPAPTTQGLLPSIPGSPVAAQASPQVAGVDPSSALQSLDAGSMF